MTVSWRGRSGIGTFWPWGGPAVKDYQARPPVYTDDPYPYEGHWLERMTPAVVAQLKNAGFDNVRWQINPGPWLSAIEVGDEARVAYMDGLLEEALDHCQANGLGVMLCPFYTGFAGLHDKIPMQGITTPGYLQLRALTVHWATLFQNRDPRFLAYELFNEPPSPGQYPASWEYETQPDLYQAVRAAAPALTIVLTCSEYSAPERMLDWTPADYDPNCIYSFHPLRPALSVLQGFIYNQYQYVNVRYPPDPSERAAVTADMIARVDADDRTDAAYKQWAKDSLAADLGYHFDLPQDGAWMRGVCDQLATWAGDYGIERSQLHAGEYGMTRSNIGYPGIQVPGYRGGTRLDRVHMYRDWTRALARLGCRRSPIHLDTNDYGITFGQNADIGPFDPLLLAAVAPKRVVLKS